jgi:hypothetical protein
VAKLEENETARIAKVNVNYHICTTTVPFFEAIRALNIAGVTFSRSPWPTSFRGKLTLLPSGKSGLGQWIFSPLLLLGQRLERLHHTLCTGGISDELRHVIDTLSKLRFRQAMP